MDSFLDLLLALAAIFAPLALAGFLIEARSRWRRGRHGASPGAASRKSSPPKSDS
jgi:hypothetical protein